MYCPDSAIVLDGTTFSSVDYTVCKGCELCVEVCPVGAIQMNDEEAS
jgi:Pyruvate/2-oxoacid:ferredoxin oxidoreductase delta subunit